MRTFAGLLAAVLATPLAIAATFVLAGLAGLLGDDGRSPWGMIVVFVLYATPIALVIVLLAGWPLALLALKRGCTRMRDFALLGAALGALPFVAYFAYVMGFEAWHLAAGSWPAPGREVATGWLADAPMALAWIALGATCGVASALAFWRVAVRGATIAPKASG